MGESGRTTKFAVSAAALALAAALAGCAPAGAPETAAASTPSGPPADGGSYGTVAELKDAVVTAGFECPEWDEHNSNKLAATSGTCSDSLTMATYASDASLEKQLELWKGFGFEADFLIGKNWMVNGEDSEALRQKLGGTIFKVSGE